MCRHCASLAPGPRGRAVGAAAAAAPRGAAVLLATLCLLGPAPTWAAPPTTPPGGDARPPELPPRPPLPPDPDVRPDAEPLSERAAGAAMGGLSAAERAFARAAGRATLVQAALAELAQQRLDAEPLRRLATQLQRAHEGYRAALGSLVEPRGVALPAAGGRELAALRERLAAQPAAALPRAYLDAAIAGHRQLTRLFAAADRQAHDALLRAWAADVLPTLQQHLDALRGAAAAPPGV